MMFYWILLFGFITQSIATKFGIPFLFLDPEYMGFVGQRAFFMMGVCLGSFVMAFNISSFILNSFRFPFLATLSRTFQKYTHNNFIIPTFFILIYVYKIFNFQYYSQLKNIDEILLNIGVFLAGFFIVIVLTLRYFMVTNKDIYKLFGVEHADDDQTSPIAPYMGNVGKNSWRVDTYLIFPWKVKIVRDTRHYQKYMLERVFRQNHLNAAVIEIVVFVTFITLGLFRDYNFIRLPAGGSILLLFTMLIMLSGVLRYWLRAWANTALIFLFIGLNFLSQFESFNPRNQAYGLNYAKNNIKYDRENLEGQVTKGHYEKDVAHTIEILNKWKANWAKKGVEKPKMILLNVSGGGLRSCVFTFRTLQLIDSTFNGDLMHLTSFITGSSGGMISAVYYRELFLSHHDSLMRANQNIENRFLLNTGKDLLNSIVFSATVADLFMNMQQFKDGKYHYVKDRAYAFEQQLSENTGHVLDKRLGDYYEPEFNAQIPMMVISPTIINDGRAMQRHSNLVIMGQDVAEYGGVFKATLGFVEEFGRGRVRNTPLCESAILGAGLGLSINGCKSIIEMQFADFVTCGFNQIVNNLAKTHYRWGQPVDVVVRMPTGAATGAGPFHSQSTEAWFFHVPGLKIVYPAFPADAKGLLAAAIEDPNPIMFFEHKALYRSISESISDDYYTIEIGKAKLVREGNDVTIVTYGLGVHWALEALEMDESISADLIDLRTLLPWDEEAVLASVKRTGKVIVMHEDTQTGGIGGEITARIAEKCFPYLDAPPVRIGALDTAIPMSSILEWNFLPKDRFFAALKQLVDY